jgi:hypothetical protein
MDFLYLLKTKFKRSKSQRFNDWLCLRHQVKKKMWRGVVKVMNFICWVLLIELVPTTGPSILRLLLRDAVHYCD